jgi:ankyrin repeat protein
VFPDETPSHQSALFDAALRGDVQVVDALLQAGAQVNARHPDNQWTALMMAAAFDHAPVISRLLSEPDVDLNATADRGQTALHIAAERGSEAAADVLLQQPSLKVNVKDQRGWTPLIWATFGDQLGVLRALLARPEVQVNLVDNDRQTAMHWAVLADHPEAARELLNRQELSLGITNRPGHHTPLDLARLLDRAALVALLEASEDRFGPDELAPDDSYPPPADDSASRPPITPSIPDPPRWK